MSVPATQPKPRAVVIDDDPVIRRLARQALLRFDFEVLEAPDGERALALFATDVRPDIILLDVDMPGMDGFSVCTAVRAMWDSAEVPIIMITGLNDMASINRAYECGANDFVSKPINWLTLGYRSKYVLRGARTAQALRSLQEQQSAILRALPDAICVFDGEGVIQDLTIPSSSVMNLPMTVEATGKSVLSVLKPDAAVALIEGIGRTLRSGDLQSTVIQSDEATQRRYFEARMVPSADHQVLAVIRDVTAQKEYDEQVRKLAFFDSLTGMPNRRHFLDLLQANVARARINDDRLALLFLDLDGFKAVNDSYGHGAGDQLLQAVSERIERAVRVGDTVMRTGRGDLSIQCARLGGDEFTVIIPDVADVGVAGRIANRIIAAIGEPFRFGKLELSVTASVGIALFPDHSHDEHALLEHADAAMYHAKATGRNNWQLYSSALV